MLYVATVGELPVESSDVLHVESVSEDRSPITQWFSLPNVRLIGAHTGCSCGFPHILAEKPIEYFDGMFDTGEAREKDLRSMRALLGRLREWLEVSPNAVELFAIWDGDEGQPPAGTIDLTFDSINPDEFFFVEHFRYRITL